MEPVSFLLDTFIQLADRIINIEKAKFKDRRVVFDEIVKPLYMDLEPIAQNYMFFFQKARQLILDKHKKQQDWDNEMQDETLLSFGKQSELQEMAQYIKKERDAMVVARVKVSEMANQIKEHIKNPDVVEYAVSIYTFFFNSPGNHPELWLPHDSKATEFLERLNESLESNYDEQDLIEYIDRVLLEMENSWGEIVRAYEKLKIYSIASPRLVMKNQIKRKN